MLAVNQIGYDVLYHAGDAIAIGPFPCEVLSMLSSIPEAHFVRGNHDNYYVDGLPMPLPKCMSEGEVAHQLWTHNTLGSEWKKWLSSWPLQIDVEHDGVRFTIAHYGLSVPNGDFSPLVREPSTTDLDAVFGDINGEVVGYGHIHQASDITGERRYINVGSLGCAPKAIARFAIIDVTSGQYTVRYKEVTYDDSELHLAFETRNVPERDFIDKAFFGGRFGSSSG